jgi:glycerophosphoryl diester phosphodiesterase
MSFSWGAVEKLHRLDKTIPTTFLLHPKSLWLQAKFSSARSIGPGIEVLREKREIAEKVKSSGRKLAVWTVDSQSDVQLCRDLGVDILITNTPSQARSFL